MIEPSAIIKENRRTIAVQIKRTGEVVVRAPKLMPLNEIQRFLLTKQDWITEKVNKINALNFQYGDFINYDKFLLFGKCYGKIVVNGVKSVSAQNGNFIIPAEPSKDKEIHKIKLFYLKQAKKWLKSRTDEIANVLNIQIGGFKVSNTRGRWGACNTRKEINLNFRVVCLAPDLIDYVIVHELMHTKEMNHSPQFWQNVAQILPNFKELRRKIHTFGFLLNLF